MPDTPSPPRKITLFTPSMAGGGAERVVLNLANSLAGRGLQVDLITALPSGVYLDEVDERVHVESLNAGRVLAALPALIACLRRRPPDILVAHQTHANLVALWARWLSFKSFKLVLCEHFNLSLRTTVTANRREGLLPWLARVFYPAADAVVAVSNGVAADLSRHAHLSPEKIQVIYNPVVNLNLLRRAEENPVLHPWLADPSIPVVLSVGRLSIQKGYHVLINAFKVVAENSPARLLILGEGEERERLESLVCQLGLEGRVDLPGFCPNPFAAMSRAALFVLSSYSEGLPTVLLEAMACGVPVISTDCPSGPAEILDQGRYGRLVPVGDEAALAWAILEGILKPAPDPAPARQRAAQFSWEAGVQKYLDLFESLM